MKLTVPTRILTLLVVAAMLLTTACASSGVGKAVQAADLQKQLVERAAVEFVKLKLKGDPRITPAIYDAGRAAYEKYQVTQAAAADALSSWKVVSSPENESKLQTALAEVTRNIDTYLAFVGKFVDLEALKAKLKVETVPAIKIKTAEAAPTWFEVYIAASQDYFRLAGQGRY